MADKISAAEIRALSQLTLAPEAADEASRLYRRP